MEGVLVRNTPTVSRLFLQRLNLLLCSLGKARTPLPLCAAKTLSYPLIPHQRHPRLLSPPFPSDVGTIQKPGGLFAWERRISSEVKSNRMC